MCARVHACVCAHICVYIIVMNSNVCACVGVVHVCACVGVGVGVLCMCVHVVHVCGYVLCG